MYHIRNTYIPNFPSAPGHKSSACVVLVSPDKDVESYAVYIGVIPTPGSVAEREYWANWVARGGTKLSFKHAQNFFPAIKDELYRR